MYGTILKLGMKAAPHLLKAGGATAVLGAGAYGAGVGTAALVNPVAPDFIKDLYKGSIEGDDDGVFKGRGLTAAVLKHFVDEGALEEAEQRRDVTKQVLGPSGYSAQELGLGSGATRYDAQTALGQKQRKDAEALRQQNRQDALRPLEMQYAELAATRADAQMARADDLALRREELLRQDQRYNERLDRDERSRRQEAIMAMMGGLTSLGAAFAM